MDYIGSYLIHSNFDLSSDHTPVTVSLSAAAINIPPPPTLTTRNTDWNMFQTYLEENTNLKVRQKSPTDIDEAVHSFTTLIQKAAWLSLLQQSNELLSPLKHLCIFGNLSQRKGGLEESGNEYDTQMTSTSITDCPGA
jgi:hypothetical protein